MPKLILLLTLLIAPWLAFAQVNVDEIRKQIPRFRQVTDSIYAGGNPLSTSGGIGLNTIADAGLCSIVNLQGGDIDKSISGWASSKLQPGEYPDAIMNEKRLWEARGLAFYNFPLRSHKPKTVAEDQSIRAALEIMDSATADKPVFVHCQHGADRTGLLIALYRVKYLGWTPEDAYAEWRPRVHSRVRRLFTGHLDVYYWKYMVELKEQTAVCSDIVS